MTSSFRAFVPIEIIEKGKKDADGLPEELLISGIASTSKNGYDKDGQILDMRGFDLDPFKKFGFFNLEHGYARTKDASLIVGEPTNAFVDDSGDLHVSGKLYKENPKAVAIYKLAQALKKSGSSRSIGYSIEGDATGYDPRNKRVVTKGVLKHMAITISPKCSGTAVLVKGGSEAFDYETLPESDLLIDINDGSTHLTVDREFNIVEKAVEAGAETGRDTTDQ
jgi:hypothetical protein